MCSAVVTLVTVTSVDTGVVDPGIGGPGVEREIVEEIPVGNDVVEDIGEVLVVAEVDVLLATVEVLIGSTPADEVVAEMSVNVAVVVAAEGLKPCDADEDIVADVEVKLVVTDGVICSAVVTLVTDSLVDTGVVDPGSGRPGVEREIVEEVPDGNDVVEDIGMDIVVLAVRVVDALLTLAVDDVAVGLVVNSVVGDVVDDTYKIVDVWLLVVIMVVVVTGIAVVFGVVIWHRESFIGWSKGHSLGGL